MARQPRFFPPGVPQHVVQRGNNRADCFSDDKDFRVYARWLTEYSKQQRVHVHAWVFMTNHVHLLVTPTSPTALSTMMQALGRRYVSYFNRRHGRTGTLWEGRFKPNIVQSETYVLNCYRYIELNPVRAGLVTMPSDYAWSSYASNASGIRTDLNSPHEEYLKLGAYSDERLAAYRALFDTELSAEQIDQIRAATNSGFALGSDRFRQEMEARYGRKLGPGRVGRPRKA